MVEPCDGEPVGQTTRYDSYVVANCVTFICILALFVHTIIQERAQCVAAMNNKAKDSKFIRNLWIIMQSIGLFGNTAKLFQTTIDPNTFILRGSWLCTFIPWSLWYCPGWFYGLYLLVLIDRLQRSFQNTSMALSHKSLLILKSLSLSIPMTNSIVISVDIPNDLTCIRSWDPPETDNMITYCIVPPESLFAFKYHIVLVLVLLICALNVVLAVIFTVRLRRLLKNSSATALKQLQFNLLIKSNALAVIGCVSTILGYMFYAIQNDSTFIYVDIFINTVIVGLFLNRYCIPRNSSIPHLLIHIVFT